MNRVLACALAVVALAAVTRPASAQLPGAYPPPGVNPYAPAVATPYAPGMATPYVPASGEPYQPAVASPYAPGMATPYVPGFGEPYQPAPGGGLTSPGAASSGPIVSLPVIPLRLTDGPGTVDVLVDGAAPFRGFQFVLTYDPAVVVVTGVTPGSLITGAGGTYQVTGPDLDRPGQVRFGAAVADTTTWPQGAGTLAQVTFAPIAQSDLVTLSFVEATLVDPNGQTVNATTRDGSLSVPMAPPPAVQTQSVAAATAMTPATPPAGSGGLNLTADINGLITSYGPMAAWLVAIVVGLAIAALGWTLGRRPTEPREPQP